jgi:hypothetical protein
MQTKNTVDSQLSAHVRKRQGKEKGVINYPKDMLIRDNYKKVHSGDDYSVLWEEPHKSVYFKGYVSMHMCEKSPTSMVSGI